MAFDGIPHSILMHKAINVIPDKGWYTDLFIQMKWNQKLPSPIKLEKETRQGGLTSPYLFNLFYQGLAEGLTETPGGLRIKRNSYNVFIYADDLLIVCTTVTGFQNLIDKC